MSTRDHLALAFLVDNVCQLAADVYAGPAGTVFLFDNVCQLLAGIYAGPAGALAFLFDNVCQLAAGVYAGQAGTGLFWRFWLPRTCFD